MEFVVYVLTRVFHRSTEDALALTFVVHAEGKGVPGTYTFEVAEQKQCEVLLMVKIEEHPLKGQSRARRDGQAEKSDPP
jgi:ATP-dependent Clp protease adaptor protein ClpS